MNRRIDINSMMNEFKLVTIDAFESGVVEVPTDCVTVDCVTVDCVTVDCVTVDCVTVEFTSSSNTLISPYSPYNSDLS